MPGMAYLTHMSHPSLTTINRAWSNPPCHIQKFKNTTQKTLLFTENVFIDRRLWNN